MEAVHVRNTSLSADTCRTRRGGIGAKSDEPLANEISPIAGRSYLWFAALSWDLTPTLASHARGRWFETSRAHYLSPLHVTYWY
jgi:hypothetical protein